MTDDWDDIPEGRDIFDTRRFYELMQAYRFSNPARPAEVAAAFEAVKEFARRRPQRRKVHVPQPGKTLGIK